jgi:hypothetical protein
MNESYPAQAAFVVVAHPLSASFLLVCGALQVYVVDNYQRRPINSIGVFTKHGFDFDDVKVAVQPGLVALLPLGPPLD